MTARVGHAAQLGVPAQLAFYPGQQFHRIKGFGHVVIRPHVQAQHLVAVLAFGGEQDNRHVAGLAQPGSGGNAVHGGHHHIQQNQMQRFPGGNLQRLCPVFRFKQGIALAGQVNFQRGTDVRVIVTDQNIIHMVPPAPRTARRPPAAISL